MTKPQFIAGYLVDPTFEEPQYLLLKRASHVYLPEIWQMVTGKIHGDETAVQAVRREIEEETSLTLLSLYNVDVTMFYNQQKDDVAFSANFCAFVSSKKEVIISNDEHSTFLWCTYSDAFNLLAFPSQKETLTFIHHYYVLEQPNSCNIILH